MRSFPVLSNYNAIIARLIACSVWLLLVLPSFSQSSCLVTNFSSQEYGGGRQNWSIDVDSQGFVYIGNNDGLLVFDGTHWNLCRTPGQSIVRSVSVGPDNRVYVGSFEEFGFWEKDRSGKMAYHSLKPLLSNYKFHNNEIWKIVQFNNKVYFQSFSSIFVFDGKSVKSLSLPGNIVFLLKAAGRLFVQNVNGSLFELRNDTLVEIPSSRILSSTEVETMIPFGKDSFLIGTTTAGMYVYNGKSVIPWDVPVNAQLRQYQVNSSIRYGDKLVIGTIVKGVFILDLKGNILNHFDNENSLQNNTVLSLCSDRNHSIWVGLDRGIGNISFDNPVDIFQEKGEELGAVYSAALKGDNLYVGTNRGVFMYGSSGGKFIYKGFLGNSQAQVWQLKEIDGSVLCGHTHGTYQIENNSFKKISDVRGGFAITKVERHGKEYLIQATYSSLVIYRKSGNGWVFSHTVDGFIEPSRFIETDHLGNIWVSHAVKGLYRLRLTDDLRKVSEIHTYGQKDGLPSDFNLRVFKIDNRVVIATGVKLFTFNDLEGKIIPYTELNRQLEGFETCSGISDAANDTYWLIRKNDIALFEIKGNHAKLLYRLLLPLYKLSMLDNYENIVNLGPEMDLICLENGFAVFHKRFLSSGLKDQTKLIWSEIYASNAGGEKEYLPLNSSNIFISHSFNNLSLSFSVIHNPSTTKLFQYKMDGLESEWSSWNEKADIKYNRLPKGEYTFNVRTLLLNGKLSEPLKVRIRVMPAWYASGWGFLCFFLLAIVLLWFIMHFLRKRIIRQHEKMHADEMAKKHNEQQIAEQQIIKLQNMNLQAEISHKNIQLADSTFSVIKKNELLIEIKNELAKQKEGLGTRFPIRYFDRINNLIDRNITNDKDWPVFESLFDQAHENFFKRLKESYPDLTQSDLKLCAYLRLNLSSKEIAPLLNISIRGVEIRRYRLRKRLALPPEINLVNYILQF